MLSQNQIIIILPIVLNVGETICSIERVAYKQRTGMFIGLKSEVPFQGTDDKFQTDVQERWFLPMWQFLYSKQLLDLLHLTLLSPKKASHYVHTETCYLVFELQSYVIGKKRPV